MFKIRLNFDLFHAHHARISQSSFGNIPMLTTWPHTGTIIGWEYVTAWLCLHPPRSMNSSSRAAVNSKGTSQILTQQRYCCTSFTYSILWFLSTFTLVNKGKKKLAVEFFALRNSPRLLKIAKRIMGVVLSPPFNRVFKHNYFEQR